MYFSFGVFASVLAYVYPGVIGSILILKKPPEGWGVLWFFTCIILRSACSSSLFFACSIIYNIMYIHPIKLSDGILPWLDHNTAIIICGIS